MRQALLLLASCVVAACVDRADVGAFGGGADAGQADGGGADDAGAAEGGPGPAIELLPATTPLAAGGMSTCAIDVGHGVKCWGDNVHGQLGIGSTSPSSSAQPLGVSGLSLGVRALGGGAFGMCALLDDGTVRCWGRSLFGEVAGGDGSVTSVDMPAPHDKTGLSNDVAEVAFGTDFACALTRAGRAKCWGIGGAGQLGDGTTSDAYAARDVAMGDDRYVHVATSMDGFFACAVISDGRVACWGKNDERQLGVGDADDRHAPTPVVGLDARAIAIAAGRAHACAILDDGGVACWGSDAVGQLGRGTAGAPSAPRRVDGVTSAKQIVAGSNHACALVASGAVVCWGANDGGAIAAGGAAALPSTEVTPASFGAVAVAAGELHTCVMTKDRRLHCVGANLRGQTGGGDFTL